MPWPPQLQDLKSDLGVSDDRDDATLASSLDAAVAYVEHERSGDFTFAGIATATAPVPPQPIVLGTLRLASRWHSRRRSPDGLIDMGELGQARITSTDSDLERLLGIGRFRRPMVG